VQQAAVIVKDLTVAYGSFIAVNNISFTVNPGEIYGLLGPNGAGKTSTIKALIGILQPRNGQIQIYGKSPLDDEVAVKSQIGYVPEEVVLFDSLNPREFFEFVASVRNLKDETVNLRLERLAYAFDIKKYFDTPIAALSRGNKQKVAIIAALFT